MSQCRCSSPNKTVRYGICAKCVPGISEPIIKEEPVASSPSIKVNVTPEISPEMLDTLQKSVVRYINTAVATALRALADELEKDDD